MSESLTCVQSCIFCLSGTIFKTILVIFVALTGMVLLIILIKFVTRKNPEKPVEGTYYSSISGFVPDCRNKHKLRKSFIHSYCTSNAQGKVVGTWSGLYRFSKAEIERAINYGNSKVHLGSGSAGQVYQGVLPSGQLVAVKHIYKTAMSDSFTSEVERLSKIRHPNLACLLGCCIENGEQYLVYEYCSNGNLAQNLLSESQNFRSFGGGKKKKLRLHGANCLNLSCVALVQGATGSFRGTREWEYWEIARLLLDFYTHILMVALSTEISRYPAKYLQVLVFFSFFNFFLDNPVGIFRTSLNSF